MFTSKLYKTSHANGTSASIFLVRKLRLWDARWQYTGHRSKKRAPLYTQRNAHPFLSWICELSTDFEQIQLPVRSASASCQLLTFNSIVNLSLSFFLCKIKMRASTFQGPLWEQFSTLACLHDIWCLWLFLWLSFVSTYKFICKS